MIRTYASLCDSRYLPQALALHESLQQHSSELFRLYLLPLDDECARTVRALALPHLELVPLDAFEVDQGLPRHDRTYREWCWSCASNLCEFLMKLGLSEITYLDSDLLCFSDLSPVFAEIGSRSIAITPHQFPDNPEKPRLMQSGLFNVGLIHFKNTPTGRACLAKWAAQVRARCSAEIGCGDQGYLDSWCSDYGDEVAVLGVGVNMGPWNLMAHDVTVKDGTVYLSDKPLVCYHFHEYSHGVRLTNYPLRPVDREIIYAPYVEAVERFTKESLLKTA